MHNRVLAVVFVCCSSLVSLIGCSTASTNQRVAVVVEIPRPESVDNERLAQAFAETAQKFQGIDGLQRKYFTFTERSFGGVYLWSNRAEADDFFSEEWKSRMETTYGAPASLTWFEVVEELESAAFGNAGSQAIVSVVRVSAPWYAPSGVIRDRMSKALPEYANIPGLDYKYFTIASGKKVGGIYLWESKDAALNFFSDEWYQRIQDQYGEPATLQFFSSPVTILDGQIKAN